MVLEGSISEIRISIGLCLGFCDWDLGLWKGLWKGGKRVGICFGRSCGEVRFILKRRKVEGVGWEFLDMRWGSKMSCEEF